MATSNNQPKAPDGYFQQSCYPLNSLIFVGPLLIVFHLGSRGAGINLLAPHLIGKFLAHFGATADILPPLLIVAVLLIQQLLTKKPWKVEPFPLMGMVAESIVWTIPLIAISEVTGRLIRQFTPAAQAGASEVYSASAKITMAIGAGIYEEFLFRLVVISLAMLLFVDVFALKKKTVAVTAIILGAIIFGLCHFSFAQLADPTLLDWQKLVFLTMAGVLWGSIYVYRGFGIAVGAHILWDLYVAFH